MDAQLFTHVCGYTLHIDELSRLHDMEFLLLAFRIAGQMQALGLTTAEECVVKGLCIMFSGEC